MRYSLFTHAEIRQVAVSVLITSILGDSCFSSSNNPATKMQKNHFRMNEKAPMPDEGHGGLRNTDMS